MSHNCLPTKTVKSSSAKPEGALINSCHKNVDEVQPHKMTQPYIHTKREITYDKNVNTKLRYNVKKNCLTYYKHSTLQLNITAMFYQFYEIYNIYVYRYNVLKIIQRQSHTTITLGNMMGKIY